MSREKATIQSVNELLRRRVQDHPDEIVVTVPDRHFNYSTYTFHQLDQAVSKLAWRLTTEPWVSAGLLSEQTPVVGFLSKSGFHYATHALALSRLGWTILFLSPNNSPAALEHLLRRTNCSTILVQPGLAKLASQAKALIDQSSGANVSIESFSEASIWEASNSVESCPARFDEQTESDHIAFIIHSSGSTGFPKPIFITHSASVHNFASNVNMRGLITLPLYHVSQRKREFRTAGSDVEAGSRSFLAFPQLVFSQEYLPISSRTPYHSSKRH